MTVFQEFWRNCSRKRRKKNNNWETSFAAIKYFFRVPRNYACKTHQIIYIYIFLFRILEFESDNLNINGRIAKAEVELWDCSGDTKLVYIKKSDWKEI